MSISAQALRVNLTTADGRTFRRALVHGAGGLLPAKGGFDRLQKTVERGISVRVSTVWTALESAWVDVPAAEVAGLEEAS